MFVVQNHYGMLDGGHCKWSFLYCLYLLVRASFVLVWR